MAKAIVLVGPDGLALAPATLCAEATEEARQLNLPLIDHVLAQLSAGKEMRANGDSSYELYQAGQCVAMLEIFDPPALNGTETSSR